MKRPSIIQITPSFEKNANYMLNYLTCWKVLTNQVFASRDDAYMAIETFVKKWSSNALYKSRYVLTNDCFTVLDAPTYMQHGFDSEDEYLDYCAYCH